MDVACAHSRSFAERPVRIAGALRSASSGRLASGEIDLLHRPRDVHASEVRWSLADVALLDEARALIGYRPGHREEDAVSTYGHIVVDEAQDLSPMQLRMIARRSLSGSLTVVGDIAQATGAWAHADWVRFSGSARSATAPACGTDSRIPHTGRGDVAGQPSSAPRSPRHHGPGGGAGRWRRTPYSDSG